MSASRAISTHTGRLLALLALAGFGAPAALADDILYCNDSISGTDYLGSALASFSGVHTITSTTDIAACETSILSGGWELVVLAIQGNGFDTPNFNSYVSGGGVAILQDWTQDATRGTAAGVVYGGINSTAMTVTLADLASGLSSPSVAFSNPGWGTYTMGMTSAATSAAVFDSGEVAIAINGAGTVIVNGFLSDTIAIPADAEQLYINEVEYLLTPCVDADEDGASDAACGGDDCDDGDPARSPGAAETPYDGIDQDCSGADLCDVDEDSFDGSACGGADCDDEDALVSPDADELYYDGIDQDCDGSSDYDADLDGHDSAEFEGSDCDDDDAAVHPGAEDAPYDGLVTDCDETDEYDADRDGHDSEDFGGDDCDDDDAAVHPGAEEIAEDGLDQDCDGEDLLLDTGGLGGDDTGDDTGAPSADDDGGKDEGCGGCSSAPAASAGLWAALAALALGWRRRRS